MHSPVRIGPVRIGPVRIGPVRSGRSEDAAHGETSLMGAGRCGRRVSPRL